MHTSTPPTPETPTSALRQSPDTPIESNLITSSVTPTSPTSPTSSDLDSLLPPSLSDLLLATATPTHSPSQPALPSATTTTTPAYTPPIDDDKENQPPSRSFLYMPFSQLSNLPSSHHRSKPSTKLFTPHDSNPPKRRPRNTQPFSPVAPTLPTSQQTPPVVHSFPRSPLADITPGRLPPSHNTFSQPSPQLAPGINQHSGLSGSFSTQTQRLSNSRKAVTQLRFAMR